VLDTGDGLAEELGEEHPTDVGEARPGNLMSTPRELNSSFDQDVAARNELMKAADDDGRTPKAEVSADAKYVTSHIVAHTWIIFVLLPVLVGIVVLIAKSQ
jgi:hypothetical protein